MTMYASKTTQRNPTNPYLSFARETIADDLSNDPIANIVAWLDNDLAGIIWCSSPRPRTWEQVRIASEQVDHARRVLTRLARLSEGA